MNSFKCGTKILIFKFKIQHIILKNKNDKRIFLYFI